jgi:hypothetical protein
MRISRQSSSVQNVIGQEQLETVEYFRYFGSMVTSDARCTREIRYKISVAKAAFNKKTLFTSKLDLNLRKNLVSVTFGA